MKNSSNWYVYILKCNGGRLYTGMTNDVKRRFEEHKTGKGGHFTKAFGAKAVIFREEHMTRSEAMKREAQIKRWSKAKKLALINNDIILLKSLG